jgi:ubiquinone/menaquinone biosynthesis C-methylase UbiE
MKRVNYDEVSKTYDSRYQSGVVKEIEDEIRALAIGISVKSVLYVGCGSGAYFEVFENDVSSYGLDYSAGMLSKARERKSSALLVRGTALQVPFVSSVFDLVTCIHAIHHFEDKIAFIKEAKRVLRRGSALAVINMDPHMGNDKWYVYKYFPETYKMDLIRYPSGDQIIGWMNQAGFVKSETRLIHRFLFSYHGREIFKDSIFSRQGSSQFSLLSDKQWDKGVGKIMNEIGEAEVNNKEAVFEMGVSIYMNIGYRV